MSLNMALTNKPQLPIAMLLLFITTLSSITMLTGAVLASNTVSADDDSVVDEINITVPISCTISGTGMNTHNANINNGLYVPDIGTTTLHAFCNDAEGFAIYAAGYTGDEVGGENSNKLVGTTASNNATIESGIATTAGNPDISNWAMKLAIIGDSGDTTGTNAFTIDSAPNVALPSEAESGATQVPFSNYHVVPNEYTKVAHKNSATDMTESTGGVKLTTTYAAYISKTQAADTYSGQVIYTLVHPSSSAAPVEPNQIGVLFHGNGQTFAGGKETNRVVYGNSYRQMYTVVNPEIIETSNLTNGEQNGGYTDSENILETRTYDGASKIRVEVEYGITGNSAEMIVFNEPWDGDWDNWKNTWNVYGGIGSNDNISGTRSFMIDGDTVTVCAKTYDTPESGYDYGFSAKIYPLYETEQENIVPLPTEYYVSNTSEIIKTSNISDDGTQNGAYTDSEYILETRTFDGASKIKVEVEYGITGNSAAMAVFNEPWDGDGNNWKDDWESYGVIGGGDDISGTRTYLMDGNTVTIYAETYDIPESGYDYGFYARIFPIYGTEHEDTTPDNLIKSFGPQIGSYTETSTWNNNWYMDTGDGRVFFEDESALMNYLRENAAMLSGSTVDVYAYNPNTICNPTATTISQMVCMQDFALLTDETRESVLDSMTPETQYTLIDSRDNKTYTIAKFQTGTDNNTNEPIYDVWMTKNLDLDLDNSRVYTNIDTDLGYNSITGEYDAALWKPERSTYNTTATQTHEWLALNNSPESYNPGDLYWNGERSDGFDEFGSYTTTSNTSIPQYHLGNYYNWIAAVAMNDSSTLQDWTLAEQSICPAGWTLPRPGSAEDSLRALLTTYGYDSADNNPDFTDSPLYFTIGGYFDGMIEGIGFIGLYSSSFNRDATSTVGMYVPLRPSELIDEGFERSRGTQIRCIARPVVNYYNYEESIE